MGTVAVLEARKLKKMDITGASDPYVKLKLFDAKNKRIGKKKKTSVKSCNLNPYWNESFVFIIDEMDMKKVTLDITVCDYDLIGGGDPIGIHAGLDPKQVVQTRIQALERGLGEPAQADHQVARPSGYGAG